MASATEAALDPPGTGLLRTLAGHSGSVNGVAVTPDGRRAVSASADKTLKVWDLETGAELRTLAGHSDRVNGVAVTPDGRRAVSASEDNTLKVWDLETRRRTAHARRPLRWCQWRGGDAGRAARRLRIRRQHAQAVGSGDRRSEVRTLAGHSDGSMAWR